MIVCAAPAAAIRAFVQLWADTAYMRAPYIESRRWIREGAAAIVAPLLGLTDDDVLERMINGETPPWPIPKRPAWVDRTTAALIGEAEGRAA